MDRSVIGFVEGIVSFVVIAATGLSVASLWLRTRAKARPELDNSALETLRDENSQLRDRMAELEERLDFVERRLVQERAPTRLPPETDRTPV